MKLLAALVASIAALATVPAQALTATAGFNVTATLTAACEVTSAPTDVAFTYTSFQTTAATAAGGAFTVRCTNTLPYTFSVNTVNANKIIGLDYTLGFATAAAPGTAITGATGTGAAANFVVTGGMVAGQSGTCATTAACTAAPNVHTLTVSY